MYASRSCAPARDREQNEQNARTCIRMRFHCDERFSHLLLPCTSGLGAQIGAWGGVRVKGSRCPMYVQPVVEKVLKSQPGHRHTKSTLTDTRSNSRETDSRKRTDICQATPTGRSPPVSLSSSPCIGRSCRRSGAANSGAVSYGMSHLAASWPEQVLCKDCLLYTSDAADE